MAKLKWTESWGVSNPLSNRFAKRPRCYISTPPNLKKKKNLLVKNVTGTILKKKNEWKETGRQRLHQRNLQSSWIPRTHLLNQPQNLSAVRALFLPGRRQHPSCSHQSLWIPIWVFGSIFFPGNFLHSLLTITFNIKLPMCLVSYVIQPLVSGVWSSPLCQALCWVCAKSKMGQLF